METIQVILKIQVIFKICQKIKTKYILKKCSRLVHVNRCLFETLSGGNLVVKIWLIHYKRCQRAKQLYSCKMSTLPARLETNTFWGQVGQPSRMLSYATWRRSLVTLYHSLPIQLYWQRVVSFPLTTPTCTGGHQVHQCLPGHHDTTLSWHGGAGLSVPYQDTPEVRALEILVVQHSVSPVWLTCLYCFRL